MARRIHTPLLAVGRINLPPSQTHHLRTVLRLQVGDAVLAFDDAGNTAEATIVAADAHAVTLDVPSVHPPRRTALAFTIAAAIPKGSRADWMVEKLSELGTHMLIPLIAARSVSVATGSEKLKRWTRLAAEAAQQSGRTGVMQIQPLTSIAELLAAPREGAAWYFSTQPQATPITSLAIGPPPDALLLLIGPEGGWTDEEQILFDAAKLAAVKLTSTILRVETAAIAAAAIAAVWRA